MRPDSDWRRSAAAGRVALVALSLSLCIQAALSQLPTNSDYTTDADWSSGISAQGPGGCTMAKKAEFKPPPTCPPPRVPVSREQAVTMGHRFAPILYQHPLDSSWLSDPATWYSQANKYETVTWQTVNKFVVPPDTGYSEQEYIEGQPLVASRLFTPKYNATSDTTNFTVVSSEELQRRAVVDPVVDGRLTGKVYYTLFRPFDTKEGTLYPHSYVYSYMLFYPWNGCSNQLLATQVDGKDQGIEYYMCADGSHEGDLEHIKVWVCEADMLNDDPSTAIRRAQYSQHGWLPDFDCTAGECNWEKDEQGTRRLVAYAGLFSHSNYNNATNLYVYEKIKLTSIINMDGLYIGDRYAKGPVFYPNQNNTLWLPYMSEMQPGQLKREFAWAAFPGTWGGTLYSTNGRTVTCLFNNLTVEGPCNSTNPAYYILSLVIRPIGASMDNITWGNLDGGNTVTGPLWHRAFAFNWELERAAPLYSESVMGGFLDPFDGLCPFEANITTPDEGAGVFPHTNLMQFLGAVVGLVLAASVVSFAMVLPILLVRREDKVLLQLKQEVELIQQQGASGPSGAAPPQKAEQLQELPAPPPAPLPPPGAPPPLPATGEVVRGGVGAAAAAAAVGSPSTAAANGSSADADAAAPHHQTATVSTTDCSESTNSAAGGGPAAAAASPTAASAAAAAAAAAAAGEADGGKPDAAGKAPPHQSVQMSIVDLSHDFITRAFHASVMHRYMLMAWMFVGGACFISAVVLGVLGIADVATALDRLVPLPLWKTLSSAISVVYAIFGIVNLAIIITSVWIRPRVSQACYAWCSAHWPCACCKSVNRMEATRRSWTAHAVLAGLLAIELNVTMLIFALGLMMWVARLGIEESCYYILTGLFTHAYFLSDVCLDLSSIGIYTPVCGADLSMLCAVWSDLNVDYLVYAGLLFVIAETMFLVLATTNYVGMRTGAAITAAMDLASQASREAEAAEAAEARRRRRKHPQAVVSAATAIATGGVRRASGWSGLLKRKVPMVAPAAAQQPDGGAAAPAAAARQMQSSPALGALGGGAGADADAAAGGAGDAGGPVAQANKYETVTWQTVNKFVVPPDTGYSEQEYIEGQPLVASRLFTPKYNATSDTTNFTVVSSEELQRRAVVDPVVDGRLTGKVYYTLFRPFDTKEGTLYPHSYVYSYMLFYPWNGCSNQLLATQVDGKDQGIEYYMCADGSHEGDLEHIKVWVCEADMLNDDPSTAIRRTQYSQHGWLPDFDCTAGQCNWEKDEQGTRRLVAYAGLFSHSNYNNATNLYVYEKIKWTSIMNMDGLYIGDRYAKGPVFYPNQNNTLWLPYMSEMQPGQLKREFAWAAFPGTWGGTLYSTNGRTVTCLFNNLTVEGPCNATNPAYYILSLVIRPIGESMDNITWGNQDGGNTVTGPLWHRAFAFNWELERAAPLYSESVMGGFLDQFDGLCPFEANITTPDEGAGVFPHTNLKQFLGAVVGLVLAASVVAFAMVLPILLVRREEKVLLELKQEVERIQLQGGSGPSGALPPHKEEQLQELPAPPPAPLPPPGAPPPLPAAEEAATGGVSGAAAVAVASPQQQPKATVSTTDCSESTDSGAGGGPAAAAAASPTAASAEAAAAAAAGEADGGKHDAAGKAPQHQSIQMSLVDMSHDFINRAFHASVMHRYMLMAWVFVGVACFISAVVLGVLGIADVATALDRLVPLPLWKTLSSAISVVYAIFGIVNLAIIITSVWIRPQVSQACYAWCSTHSPCACCKSVNRMEATRQSWTAHAVLAGLLAIELNVTMLIFSLGLMMWVARLGIEESCYYILTGLFTQAYFLSDVCLDLSSIGIYTPVCGADLSMLCAVWSDLNVDYLVYAGLLFVIAETMFLVLPTTNYVGMRTGAAITAAMDLASQASREAEAAEARRRRRKHPQAVVSAATAIATGGVRRASGWSGMFRRKVLLVAPAALQQPDSGAAAPAAAARQVQSSPALGGLGGGAGDGADAAAAGRAGDAGGPAAQVAPPAGQAASRE
ncbi:hypothetical protein HXX76_012368 [Chlamydomonas incerta]|uniref:Uncharacterized protein n=1 Tax=Chlamydomonas incerta TaxID=51695 RepID=A0A835SHS1_CHLIN|nr:hypothetical protein HXX76_012368 [Chlamydomonas incerta]|eukprot:KAG2427432.1 hypothetical protein HXX76_012368 [Chlamydomonas incerta]